MASTKNLLVLSFSDRLPILLDEKSDTLESTLDHYTLVERYLNLFDFTKVPAVCYLDEDYEIEEGQDIVRVPLTLVRADVSSYVQGRTFMVLDRFNHRDLRHVMLLDQSQGSVDVL